MKRSSLAPETHGSSAPSIDGAASGSAVAGAASFAVLAVEMIGSLLMWAPIPIAWLWIGARVYDAAGSLVVGGLAAIGGIVVTTWLGIVALNRLDGVWISLRRQAGHDQEQGALTQVVVISFTLLLVGFMAWNIMNRAMIIPFMPNK